jgi:hypothetical protein
LSLLSEDRPVPADAIDSVQVKLSEMKLERARKSVAWSQVLELLG